MAAALQTPASLNFMHGELAARGWKLLQPFRFGPDDESHIRALLDFAEFPEGARVLDVGCGVGECARLMKLERPDLDFVLLNFSEAQLYDCPAEFDRQLADAHDLPFEDESFDAVMFHAALGNMDAMVALAEASRVLKPGGVLFLNEIAREGGPSDDMERLLSFRAYDRESLSQFAAWMGMVEERTQSPAFERAYLAEYMDSDDYAKAFQGATPTLWRFVKGGHTPVAAKHGAIFGRHDRIALQFSGGKDSLAVLAAMAPWWDRLCVYWVNPGNPFRETLALMARINDLVPNFVEISGRQREIIAADGWPSDVVPQAYTSDGNFVFGPTPFKVQTRLSCCYRSLMLPMHERMKADGVTCIIRGKRAEEKDRSPTRTGSVIDGIETVYPLWDWSESDVLDFLENSGIPLPESYRYASHSLDCMDCSSWWGEGLSRFLEAKYPDQHKEYVRRIVLIKKAVAEQLAECEV